MYVGPVKKQPPLGEIFPDAACDASHSDPYKGSPTVKKISILLLAALTCIL
jgi:hypothetical protein